MSPKQPATPAEHLTRAKTELAAGDHQAANSHALLAIAGLLEVAVVMLLTDDVDEADPATCGFCHHPWTGHYDGDTPVECSVLGCGCRASTRPRA